MDVDYNDEEDSDRTINGAERYLGGDVMGMEEEEEGEEGEERGGEGEGMEEEEEEEEEFWGGEAMREKDLVSPELPVFFEFSRDKRERRTKERRS